MLEIILFFKKNNILIIDSRNIERAYEMHPTYLERIKCSRRENKDLMKKINNYLHCVSHQVL